MSSAARTQDELRRASEHLHYEVTMLNATAGALMTPNALPNEVTTNVVLEAFTIHARALLHFFFPTKPKANDVLAAHYFADELAWPKARGRKPQALEQVSGRVGAEIAHLSYGRLLVAPEAKGWNVPAIYGALLGLVAVFLEHVPCEKLATVWNHRRIPAVVAAVGTDRVVSTASTNTLPIVGSSYAIPQPGKGTMVNTIAPPVPFKTSN